MVSKIKTDVIEKSDGSPVDLTGQSAAKGWINLNGIGAVTVRDSLNVASLTDAGTGDYRVNLTNSMLNTNYDLQTSGSLSSSILTYFHGAVINAPYLSAGVLALGSRDYNSTQDGFIVSASIEGDLA